MRASKLAAAALGLLLLILPSTSHSAAASIRSKVYGILTGDRFSGCMVQVNRFPPDSGLNCPNDRDRVWVTLDCAGQRMARSEADRNLRQAQTALLAGNRITIRVRDDFKAEGWCLGTQVILFR